MYTCVLYIYIYRERERDIVYVYTYVRYLLGALPVQLPLFAAGHFFGCLKTAMS